MRGDNKAWQWQISWAWIEQWKSRKKNKKITTSTATKKKSSLLGETWDVFFKELSHYYGLTKSLIKASTSFKQINVLKCKWEVKDKQIKTKETKVYSIEQCHNSSRIFLGPFNRDLMQFLKRARSTANNMHELDSYATLDHSDLSFILPLSCQYIYNLLIYFVFLVFSYLFALYLNFSL